MSSQVSIIKCKDYDPELVQSAVKRAIGLLGGITNFIKPRSKVLVKPNLLMAKEPQSGVDTHPEVVRAAIKILKEINCKILVGDGPSVWGNQIEDVTDVYRLSGVSRICEEEGVELVRFDKRRMRRKFPLTTYLDECDHLVSIPKFKTHGFTILSGAIKNLFGLVSGTFKTELHKRYFEPEEFAKTLVDIYQQTRPSLTIVDGILAMEGDGPATSGKLRTLGLLLAGSDAIAIDSVMADIMGLKPEDCFTTREAYRRGLGQADLSIIEIAGENYQDLKIKPFLLPASSKKRKLPKPLLNAISRFIRYYPFVLRSKCVKCSACVNICPHKCVSLKKQGIVFNYAKCIACFCCQEVCPAAAIKVKKSLLAKMIGL